MIEQWRVQVAHVHPQAPIGSGFDASSTAAEVTSAGATVIVPARDRAKAAAALAGIDGVELEAMELIDPVSIDAFAAKFVASGRPLHILVNSAGIMANPLTRDARGYESQLATTPLGHSKAESLSNRRSYSTCCASRTCCTRAGRTVRGATRPTRTRCGSWC